MSFLTSCRQRSKRSLRRRWRALVSVRELDRSARDRARPDPAFLSARMNQMGLHRGGRSAGYSAALLRSASRQRTKQRNFRPMRKTDMLKDSCKSLAELMVVLREACVEDERGFQPKRRSAGLKAVYEWMDNGVWHGVGEPSSTMPGESRKRLQKERRLSGHSARRY